MKKIHRRLLGFVILIMEKLKLIQLESPYPQVIEKEVSLE